MEGEKKDAAEIEEALVNAYMEAASANGEGVEDKDRREYYRRRYDVIRATYRGLLLQREEVAGYPKDRREELLNKLTPAFRENYTERKRVVTELRRLGEKVDDPFVPLSSV